MKQHIRKKTCKTSDFKYLDSQLQNIFQNYLLLTFYTSARGMVYKSVGYPSKKITVNVKYTKTTD